jgi:hypothetical protein
MGEIRQITTGRGRKYIHVADDGTETAVPSVTTILGGALPKPGLDWWGYKLGLKAAQYLIDRYNGTLPESFDALYEAAKQTDHAPHRALKAAGSRGTDVHNVAETLLKTGTLDALPAGTKADEGYVDALVKWHEQFEIGAWEIIAVEARLFSTRHLFAGTCDFVARKPDGVYVVGDFKTSAGIHASHLLQTAAYMDAAVECGLIPEGSEIEGQVIRLGIDGDFEVQRSAYTIEDFNCVLDLYRVLNDKTKKGIKLDADK